MKRRLLLLFVLLTATIGMAQEKEMNIKAEEISYQADILKENIIKFSGPDSLSLYTNIVEAATKSMVEWRINSQLTTNNTGKIAAKALKRNNRCRERITYLRPKLADAGRWFERKDRTQKALEAYMQYVLTDSVSKDSSETVGDIDARIAHIYLAQRNYGKAELWADKALGYDTSAQMAAEIKAQCIGAQMKTNEDSTKYLAVINRLYETEPYNDTYFSWLMEFFSKKGQERNLEQWVDNELMRNPYNNRPWILKAEIAMHAERWDEAIEAYKTADNINPHSPPVVYNIGVCLASKAMEEKDKSTREKIIVEAKAYLERVQGLDPRREKVDWVKALYNVYLMTNDKIKAEELKPLTNR